MRRLELTVSDHKVELPDDVQLKDGDKVVVLIAESADDFMDELKQWENVGIEDLCNTLEQVG